MTGTDDECRLAIWRLQQTIGRQLPTEVAESEPALVVAGNAEEGTRTVTVRCGPRPADNDRLWFWLDPDDRSDGQSAKPLIEADRLADAVVHICGERQIRDRRDDWAELS